MVLDEIVLSRATTYDACSEFLARFKWHAGGLVVTIHSTDIPAIDGRKQTQHWLD